MRAINADPIPLGSLAKAGLIMLAVGGGVGYEAYRASQSPIELPHNSQENEIAPLQYSEKTLASIGTSENVKSDFVSDVVTKEGGSEKNTTGWVITSQGKDFNLGTVVKPDGSEEWWLQTMNPNTKQLEWSQLSSTTKNGKNSDGQTIEVTTWMLGEENVLWYPKDQSEWQTEEKNPNLRSGLVFMPPKVFGDQPVPNYDRTQGGILIPLKSGESSDPFSPANIFEAIAYRTNNQLNITPTAEPTEQISKPEEIMNKAETNFVSQLVELSKSSNPAEATLLSRLQTLQTSGAGIATMSEPVFDPDGNFVERTGNPVLCGYDVNGNFVVIINTSMYIRSGKVDADITAAHFYQCLEYQSVMERNITSYQTEHPELTRGQIIHENPGWGVGVSNEAWLSTARDILTPNKDKLPPGNSIYRKLVDLYSQSAGDLSRWNDLIKNTKLIQTLST